METASFSPLFLCTSPLPRAPCGFFAIFLKIFREPLNSHPYSIP